MGKHESKILAATNYQWLSGFLIHNTFHGIYNTYHGFDLLKLFSYSTYLRAQTAVKNIFT